MGENDSVTATLYPGACTEMQTASSVNWPGVKLHLSNTSGTTRLQRNHRCIYPRLLLSVNGCKNHLNGHGKLISEVSNTLKSYSLGFITYVQRALSTH